MSFWPCYAEGVNDIRIFGNLRQFDKQVTTRIDEDGILFSIPGVRARHPSSLTSLSTDTRLTQHPSSPAKSDHSAVWSRSRDVAPIGLHTQSVTYPALES